MSQQTHEVYSGSKAPGNEFCPNVKAALEAINTMHSGDSAPEYKEQGTWWYDTANDEIKWYDGAAWLTVLKIDETNAELVPVSRGVPLDIGEVALAANDATPSISGGVSFKTANSSATTITDFDDGVAGQIITLRAADANTTIDGDLTCTGMTIPLIAGDTLQWVYDGSAWQQIGGSVGMGRFVPLDPTVSISGWIASSVTSFTDIDVSTIVRKGCSAILLHCHLYTSGTPTFLYLRPNGNTETGSSTSFANILSAKHTFFRAPIGLDNDAIFEAYFSSAWVAVSNLAYVAGYYI